jgi:radical SAM superfamily enzyme with C-terminal helix-hairpin-helix motif
MRMTDWMNTTVFMQELKHVYQNLDEKSSCVLFMSAICAYCVYSLLLPSRCNTTDDKLQEISQQLYSLRIEVIRTRRRLDKLIAEGREKEEEDDEEQYIPTKKETAEMQEEMENLGIGRRKSTRTRRLPAKFGE